MVGPQGPSLVEQVRAYRESLAPIRDRIAAWDRARSGTMASLSEVAVVVALVFAIGSITGLLPYLVARETQPQPPSASTFAAQFIVAWGVLAAISVGAWYGATLLNRKVAPKTPPATLSPDQLTVIAARSAADSVERYFQGRADHYLSEAGRDAATLFGTGKQTSWRLEGDELRVKRSALKQESGEYRWRVPATEMRRQEMLAAGWPAQVARLETLRRLVGEAVWATMDSGQTGLVDALIEMGPKVQSALAERRNLDGVREVMGNFSVLAFVLLPENRSGSVAGWGSIEAAQAAANVASLVASLPAASIALSEDVSPGRLALQVAARAWNTLWDFAVFRLGTWTLVFAVILFAIVLAVRAAVLPHLSDDTVMFVVLPSSVVGAGIVDATRGRR